MLLATVFCAGISQPVSADDAPKKKENHGLPKPITPRSQSNTSQNNVEDGYYKVTVADSRTDETIVEFNGYFSSESLNTVCRSYSEEKVIITKEKE